MTNLWSFLIRLQFLVYGLFVSNRLEAIVQALEHLR